MIVHGPVTYSRPTTLDAALVALRRPGACIYAGGTDLLVQLQLGAAATAWIRELVDIKGIHEARGITLAGASIRIGALTTAEALASSTQLRRLAPALAEAARATSAPLLRRRGTLGGNLATPHPAPDVCTALLALGATVEVVGGRGARRRLALERFLAERRSSARNRLVVAVHVPPASASAYEKLADRRGFARAIVAAGIVVRGRFATIALSGISDRPEATTVASSLLTSSASVLDTGLEERLVAFRALDDTMRAAAVALVRRAAGRLA